MGVKDLWHLAAGCEERISLHELRGQTLAIDLAGWVVQNQTAPGLSHGVTRPHLRNLFFRTQTLLSLDILPIFVLDGAAPLVKSATVVSRNAARGLHHQGVPRATDSPKRQQRRQFGAVLRDCAQLLASLGVPCVTAPGEAEAYCAALDAADLVDGVVSNDSDCLCYGARTVYRHFSSDPKNFSVSRYTAQRLEEELGLSRERIIGLALLLGCDYVPGGVCGVGREALIRLYGLWGRPDPGDLDRILGWNGDGDATENRAALKRPHCGTCGHPGTVGQHTRNGCMTCGSAPCRTGLACDCDYHSEANQVLVAELAVRSKAVSSPGWPHRDVVDEFLSRPGPLLDTIIWSCPVPAAFLKLAKTRLEWEQEYSVEKFLLVAARWQVKNPGGCLAQPTAVLKKRIKGGEDMVEVEWRAVDPCLPATFIACVPLRDFYASHSSLLTLYEEARIAGRKKSSKPTKTTKQKTEQELLQDGGNKENFNGKMAANKPPKARQKKVDYTGQRDTHRETKKPVAQKVEKAEFKQPGIKAFLLPSAATKPSPEKSMARPANAVFRKTAVTADYVGRRLAEASIVADLANDTAEELLSRLRLDDDGCEVKRTSVYSATQWMADDFDTRDLNESEMSLGGHRDWLDESYNSEISLIVDDIIGRRGSVGSCLAAPAMAPVCQLFSTSTPEGAGCGGRRGGASQQQSGGRRGWAPQQQSGVRTSIPKEAGDLTEDQADHDHHGSPEEQDSTEEEPNSSRDEFDLEVTRNTPFLERVKKRLM